MSEDTNPAILIVDDEAQNLELLERTLGMDFEVFQATSGEQAMEMLPSIQNLAVIITDQRMPGLAGTQLLTMARAMRSDAIRIILTGYTDPKDLIEAINSSRVYRYLTKPWDIDDMTGVVHRAVRLWQVGGGDTVDEATGLLNRRTTLRALQRELDRAVQYQGEFLAVALRCPNFEQLIENIGAAAADTAMAEVAKEIQAQLTSTDELGSIEPGTMVVLLSSVDTSSLEKLEQAVEQACASGPLSIRSHSIRCPTAAATVADVMTALDLAT